uniref:Rab-GAP TBC domain-containing protein n=1 Tax=Globisporangium ultimum (strain ATCC 200006 / CBS 805.95 / DAOM BR144) TaxID=431595 RepID=K3WQ83_GLOUD
MALNRNFRTTYYKTLGVPVMQRIAMYASLFGDPVVSRSKVMKLVQEIGVPSQYRAIVWQLLAGVLPPYPSLWEFALEQQQEMFQDIVDAAQVLCPSARSEDRQLLMNPTNMQSESPSCTWREGDDAGDNGGTENEAELGTKTSSMLERCHLIRLHRTYWCEILAHQELLNGMQDEEFLDAVARMVCDVFGSEMERFWCFVKLVDVFHDGLSQLRPVVPLQSYHGVSVSECEVLFLRTLDALKKSNESYITHATQ